MRLYPKKLRNIADLEREKRLVEKESKRLDKEDFLSLENILDKKKDKNKDNGSKEGSSSLVDLLPISNPILGMVLRLLERRFISGSGTKNSVPVTERIVKSGKSKLKALAFEVIGGYLKWKAIELSYKGISNVIKKRKEQRAYKS